MTGAWPGVIYSTGFSSFESLELVLVILTKVLISSSLDFVVSNFVALIWVAVRLGAK